MEKLTSTIEKPVYAAANASGITEVVGAVSAVASIASDIYEAVNGAIVMGLSKAWIITSIRRPSSTLPDSSDTNVFSSSTPKKVESRTFDEDLDRADRTKMWSMQLDEFFMPLSQTYTIRAKKRLNVSSLVDGVDIIQQTRKEMKTIDCSLRISLREDQPNLQIVKAQNEIAKLGEVLTALYDSDKIFKIDNATINDTFGVVDVFMTDYKFAPSAGKSTFVFEFTLTQVILNENTLTFDLNQISQDEPARTRLNP